MYRLCVLKTGRAAKIRNRIHAYCIKPGLNNINQRLNVSAALIKFSFQTK